MLISDPPPRSWPLGRRLENGVTALNQAYPDTGLNEFLDQQNAGPTSSSSSTPAWL